ncbi:hypothetical protein ACLSSQ_09170 [Azospira sp. APE16]|uniref:hypothetical protein n=1 Tax=Azospira sp. APE16 TaxID=3394231 RepID=UPI003A4E5738
MDHSAYIELLEQDRDNMMAQRDNARLQRDEVLKALKVLTDYAERNGLHILGFRSFISEVEKAPA